MECLYEEKNENAVVVQSKEVELIETALRETTLRETRIDDVIAPRTQYLNTLEAQSSVDSDVIAHNVCVSSFLLFRLRQKSLESVIFLRISTYFIRVKPQHTS